MKCIYKPIIIKSICVHVSPSLIVTTNKNKRNAFGTQTFWYNDMQKLNKKNTKKTFFTYLSEKVKQFITVFLLCL